MVAILPRGSRRVYAPTSNTAGHNNYEKISSWVSFSFLYGYRTPLGGRRSAIRELKQPRRRQGGLRPEVTWKAVRKGDLRNVVHLSSTTSKGVVSRRRELRWTWRVITAWKERIYYRLSQLSTGWRFYSFLGCFEILCLICWLQNRLKLFSFLTQTRQLSIQVRRKPPRKQVQAAEFYLSILKTLSCGLCFLHFAHVLKCPSCFITV